MAQDAAFRRRTASAGRHGRRAANFVMSANLRIGESPPDSLEAALNVLVKRASGVAGGAMATVAVRDPRDPRRIVARAGHGVVVSEMPIVDIDEGVSGKTIRTGQTVSVKDYQRCKSRIDAPAFENVRAAVSLPITWNGQVRAALTVFSERPRRFAQRDVAELADIAQFASYALENAEAREQLEETFRSTIASYARAIDLRDGYTAEHSNEVANLARRTAAAQDVSATDASTIEVAALMHDLGKLGVPDAILHKAAALDEREWEVIRQHPGWGAELLQMTPALGRVAELVRAGHEHWDGSGYPNALHGEQIPLGARILLACDAYHAMISERSYRPAVSPTRAIAELRANAGTQFDPTVAETLIAVLRGEGLA